MNNCNKYWTNDLVPSSDHNPFSQYVSLFIYMYKTVAKRQDSVLYIILRTDNNQIINFWVVAVFKEFSRHKDIHSFLQDGKNTTK